ncbi:MAG TPA: CmcJ/NvfI family oxidoreductase [Acidimicrobiales bacterium]|nr:CmcJ/NvfI family oxidoreductase [Acidimicrobiales bacterium]
MGTTFCRATLNYIPGGDLSHPGSHEVEIRDARRAVLPGWEACGFELVAHRSAVQDWSNEDELSRVHHAEMAALAETMTGCDLALVSGHIKRSPVEAARHHDLGPITLVHSDFADSYGDLLRARYRSPDGEFRRSLDDAGITADDVANARRLVILQFWRNLGPEKMDLPLAFCDARTVGRDEIHAFPVTNYAGGGFDFEALGVVSPADARSHEWYAFPELRIDEVVAFRTYDSERVASGEPYWTPHSAFRDPEVRLGEPSRSSIELRATCLFS